MAEPPVPLWRQILEGFRTSWLVAFLGVLFAIDLVVPDPFPFFDEAALAVATLVLARWRGRRVAPEPPRKPPVKNVTPGAR